MVHYNSPILVVDLSIYSSIADEVDNPLLALILGKIQTLSKIFDVDPLVNLAIRLRDQMSCRVDK